MVDLCDRAAQLGKVLSPPLRAAESAMTASLQQTTLADFPVVTETVVSPTPFVIEAGGAANLHFSLQSPTAVRACSLWDDSIA